MEVSFQKESEEFIKKINSLKNSLPYIIESVYTRTEEVFSEIVKFVEDNSKKEDLENKIRYLMRYDKIRELNSLYTEADHMERALDTIPKSFIVSLISQYDAYLGNLIRTIYIKKPQKLKRSDKEFNYTDIIKFNSIDEIKEYVIEKEIETVLRKSHAKQFDWLEKLLGMTLRKGLDIWPTFIEVTERRNLFVHCDGVVSSQYIKNCERHKVDLDGIKLGDQLKVSHEYFKKAYKCIFEIGVKLAQVVWRKLEPKCLEDADHSLINIIHNLLLDKEFVLAQTLAEFASNLPDYSSEEKRLMLIVNKALAYKWDGNNEKCCAIIKDIDWSALSDKFKLAYAVMLDNFGKAASLMKQIGNNGEVTQINYRHWSLFKEFRTTIIFQKTYSEIFNEKYEIIEHETEERNDIQKEVAVTKEYDKS